MMDNRKENNVYRSWGSISYFQIFFYLFPHPIGRCLHTSTNRWFRPHHFAKPLRHLCLPVKGRTFTMKAFHFPGKAQSKTPQRWLVLPREIRNCWQLRCSTKHLSREVWFMDRSMRHHHPRAAIMIESVLNSNIFGRVTLEL